MAPSCAANCAEVRRIAPNCAGGGAHQLNTKMYIEPSKSETTRPQRTRRLSVKSMASGPLNEDMQSERPPDEDGDEP